MLMTLQVEITGAVVKSLRDLLNVSRGTKNTYPKIDGFCKYLSLHRIGGNPVHIVGSPDATASDSGFIIPSEGSGPPFVLEDMNRGLIPLEDIYLLHESPASTSLRVVLIQD